MYIFGDTHANWPVFSYNLNTLPENSNVIVAGDFGIWQFEKYSLSHIDNSKNHNIYFCPGNHENWEMLEQYEKDNPDKDIIEIYPKIHYCTFASVLKIEGYNIMFCGGADSIDKCYRRIGVNWFPNEVITERDMRRLPRRNDIDIIVSHTAPKEVIEPCFRAKNNDPSCKYLSMILEMYHPSIWFYGHFHKSYRTMCKGTSFYQLNRESKDNSSGHYIFQKENGVKYDDDI